MPKDNPFGESFNPLGSQIKDIVDQAKLSTLDKKSDQYAENMIDWLRETDIAGVWEEESLKATAVFFKVAYKAGFKEAMR